MKWLEHKITRGAELVLFAATTLLVAYALYVVFMLVPNERQMGAVQRIFYFHVGSALACYSAFFVVLVASVVVLRRSSEVFDVLAQAAAEVGFVFCTMVLASGMIWGNSIWNTPFNWEPRLVSFLLLWFIFLSYNLLRHFGDPSRILRHCAVLGIIGAVTIPIVVVSIKFLPQSMQLHPQVLAQGGLKDPLFKYALGLSIAALQFLLVSLLYLRFRLGLLLREVSYG
jgi:heme exporter protein C